MSKQNSTKLEWCGTARGVLGFVLASVPFVRPSLWYLAIVGVSLIFWALWDVARLKREEEKNRHG
jgi:hypothetical protein